MKVAASIFALGLMMSTAAFAGLDEGLVALDKQDFETARAELEGPAEEGDALAQYHMGAMYHGGFGGERSEQKALRYYQSSAEKGNADAQFQLGYFYQKGKAWLEKNPDSAVAWYNKAAQQGSVASQYNLAMMYATGEAVPVAYGSNPDYIKSRGWFLIVRDHVDMEEDRAKVTTQIKDLEGHMTPRQLRKSEEFHKDWMAQYAQK
ncbi:tetratricopeptide repeat protein [Terasakiella sp. A23]|uniref:tetratricopeptide repeat protein n=1 Tax=Terasakiella sp. FCG-A23 TaxID=3080561 RepID=UPI002955A3E2|nr:tetratricopeptide repeat protein [Terasakiella sp. A23]MDV7339149.1 tetratricopeptide repeat protein [Terasakiella sp. A23]